MGNPLRALARELLDIQQGSVEDAIVLAEDYPDEEDREKLIEYIEELGEREE